jgi:DNA-binding CsgD family transcriptional regulator
MDLEANFTTALLRIVPKIVFWKLEPETFFKEKLIEWERDGEPTKREDSRLSSICIITHRGTRRTFVSDTIGISEQANSDLISLLIAVFQRADELENLKHRKFRPLQVPLTQAEKHVLEWVQDGKTTWETATILRISSRTVKFHLSNAFAKLNATTRTQAVALAQARGLIRLQSENSPLSNEMA